MGVALEELGLKGKDHVVIGSKIVPGNCFDVEKHCNETLSRLGVKSIELYMVHWPINKNSIIGF